MSKLEKKSQLGFLDWKQVGFLIKHSKPNEFIIRFFALNSHVEIANQHKVLILTGKPVCYKIQIIKKIVFIL